MKRTTGVPNKDAAPLGKPKTLLRFKAVKERVPGSTSAIYQKIKDGLFPKPVKIGKRAVAWVEDEIDAYIEKQIAQRDNAQEKPITDAKVQR